MKSIWSETPMPKYDSLQGDIRTDVLIIGGGMAGLLCAMQLQNAGVSCVVAEADTIASKVTENTTAKLTSQHGLIYHKIAKKYGLEAAGQYLQANEDALEEFRRLCREVPCGFKEQSHHVYTTQNRNLLEEELSTLIKLHYPAELLEEVPLPFPTLGAVKFPRQAQFHPKKFLAGIARNLTVYEHTPVRQLVKTRAVTSSGTIHAEKIIVATHFPFLNKHGSYFLKMYQNRSYVIGLKGAGFDGMYLDEQENGLSFRSFADTLLLGGGGHRTGKSSDGWEPLKAFAREYYPGNNVTHQWAAQDCMTLDGLPYIGHYSARTPNLYVATGFNKWGMTGSMVASRLLCDQILGKGSPFDALFSPSRSMVHPQLAVNALESTVNLLTPTSPRCPHLGCALKWNPQEHSWDCPCHGSRFSENGKLLDNPATGDLPHRE